MNLTFTPSAWDDYQWFVQHDRKLVKRINQLIQDVLRAPFEGIGKPESLKGDLVRDLVSSFTGTGPQLKVDDDTELFDAGALPTGEGKSITSYKDIVSLANEDAAERRAVERAGEPSLVVETDAGAWIED